jgi:hypothetical protein
MHGRDSHCRQQTLNRYGRHDASARQGVAGQLQIRMLMAYRPPLPEVQVNPGGAPKVHPHAPLGISPSAAAS